MEVGVATAELETLSKLERGIKIDGIDPTVWYANIATFNLGVLGGFNSLA